MDYKITVITPTTDRYEMLAETISQFYAQDYPGKMELLIISDVELNISAPNDDPLKRIACIVKKGTISDKLNYACSIAKGEIVMRFDDDDYRANDWVSKSVSHLVESKADMTGLKRAYFYRPGTALYLYHYRGKRQYVLGGSMCFWLKTWEKSRGKFFSHSDKGIGEDARFCDTVNKISAHSYTDGFIAMLHGANTSGHTVETNPYAIKVDINIVKKIMNV